MVWTNLTNNKFLVKLLYASLELGVVFSFPKSVIWNSWVPSKVIFFFAWEASLGKVVTIDQLQKRRWSLTNRCFRCKVKKESIYHLLFHFSKVRVLWQLLFDFLGVQ